MKVLVFPALLCLAVYNAHLEPPKPIHWTGTVSNGMRGDKISFDVAPDGKTVSNLTFQGHWRCAGQLEQATAGPEQTFAIQSGKTRGVVVDLPKSGATARRYEFDGRIGKGAAQGTFRMNIDGRSCDTYPLQWTAAPVN